MSHAWVCVCAVCTYMSRSTLVLEAAVICCAAEVAKTQVVDDLRKLQDLDRSMVVPTTFDDITIPGMKTCGPECVLYV